MAFKVRNWPACEAGLRRLGRLTSRIEDGALECWQTHHHGGLVEPAGIARMAGNPHPQLRRHDAQLLGAQLVGGCSLPTQLIGFRMRVCIYHDRLECIVGGLVARDLLRRR